MILVEITNIFYSFYGFGVVKLRCRVYHTLAAASLRGEATATSSTKFDGMRPLLLLSCHDNKETSIKINAFWRTVTGNE